MSVFGLGPNTEQPGKSRSLQGFGSAQLPLAGHSRVTAVIVGLGATSGGSEMCWGRSWDGPKNLPGAAAEVKSYEWGSEVFLKMEGCL